MVHLEIVDGGDSLQIWRVAVNILNKQLWTANKQGLSAWGLGSGLTTPNNKNLTQDLCSSEVLCGIEW
jgi:hypothetical protein